MKSMLQALLVFAATLTLAVSAGAQDDANKGDDLAAHYDFISFQTTHGEMVLLLDKDRAPISAKNFKQYVTDGHYDGTVFHRVMKDFVIQGGGFDANMKPKPLRAPIKNEWRNMLKNIRGALSMARTQVHDSATSQFFINTVDNEGLDQPRDGAAYAVFGSIIEGLDVVDKIRNVPVGPRSNGMQNVPIDPMPAITKAAVISWDDLTDTARVAVAEWDTKATKWHAPAIEEKKALEERNRLVEARFDQINKALASDKAEQNDNGIAYVDEMIGDGVRPKGTEVVIVKATGWTPDGKVWWRTEDEDRKMQSFPLAALSRFKGLQRSLLEMNIGGTRLLHIPAELAFGEDGYHASWWLWNDVPPNTDVVMEVTLVGFQKDLEFENGELDVNQVR